MLSEFGHVILIQIKVRAPLSLKREQAREDAMHKEIQNGVRVIYLMRHFGAAGTGGSHFAHNRALALRVA